MKTNIDHMRHTLAHLLAAGILELHPGTLLTIGPAVDNGFYYDIQLPAGTPPISDKDLPKILKAMKKLLPSWKKFEHREVSAAEAREMFAGNPFKLELVEEIAAKGEAITLYTCGKFTDLCRGGHLENPAAEIDADAFVLDRVAGAYWRGSEDNAMLTRIYGLAFATKAELDEYLTMREESLKRDHRKLGKELDIFAFDDDVGPGLPLWLPNGAIIIEELEKLAKQTELEGGYKRVRTPQIAKESMYLKSGHLPYYADSMYPPMKYEGETYYLRAMNCPHHHKVFAARPKSYRDLPLRLAEYGTMYRHEKSGELFGLMRVRMLQMNDAHIYCTEEQFADEFRRVNDMYLKYFKIFGIKKYVMRFSTHEPKRLGEKYFDEPALWKKTEDMVRKTLIESNIPYVEVPNEAAFYGPKIDVQVWSAIGREFTLATNQVDFAVPGRFGLTFTNKEGKPETPLCIHRAPLGTHERFIGFLIEHFAGLFPMWLAPVQVKVLTIGEAHAAFAEEIHTALLKAGIRSELDNSGDGLGKKVRAAKVEKVPYFLIIGDKEVESKQITIENREKGNIGTLPLDELVAKFVKEIQEKGEK